MSLYSKMYDAIQGNEDFISMSEATEYVAKSTALDFLWWYQQHKDESWANGLDNMELYNQFEQGL